MAHYSYHGGLNRKDAETVLKQHEREHCYLTRLSGSYKISLKYFKEECKIKHLKIETTRSGEGNYAFSIREAEDSREFEDFSEMLEHYEKEPISCKIPSLGDIIMPGDMSKQCTFK